MSASSINGGNFNRYWYANNNPYKFTDPDGRLARSICFLQIRCQSSPPRQEKKLDEPRSEPNCTADECIDIPQQTRGQWGAQAEEDLASATKDVAKEGVFMLPIGRAVGRIGKWLGFGGKVSKVDIKAEHALRRIPAQDRDAVSQVVQSHLSRRGLPAAGETVQETITVNGKTYSYRAFDAPNGGASVGTIVEGNFARNVAEP